MTDTEIKKGVMHVTFETTAKIETDQIGALAFHERVALLDAVIGEMSRTETELWLHQSIYRRSIEQAFNAVVGREKEAK